MNTTTIILVGSGVLAVAVLVLYNRLVRLRNRIDSAWSQVGVELRRRYDLIPNLIETVKGYAAHEKDVFERVVRARLAGMQAGGVEEQAQAESMLAGALRQLFALSEAYPALMASQNYLALQAELAQTEGRIAFARQYYNESVLRYDNGRSTFPGNLVARTARFGPRPYFQVEDEARNPVAVRFP